MPLEKHGDQWQRVQLAHVAIRAQDMQDGSEDEMLDVDGQTLGNCSRKAGILNDVPRQTGRAVDI